MRCLVSIGILAIFAFLSLGTASPGPEKTSVYLGNGIYRVTLTYGSGIDNAEIYEGPQDEHGLWNGRVTMDCRNGLEKQVAEYKNGFRHGWTVYYDHTGKIYEAEYYENGRLAEPPETQETSGSLDLEEMQASPASPTSTYQRLEKVSPWFASEMEIFYGISREQLNGFLEEIDGRIAAANPQNEAEIINAFSAAVSEVGEMQEYVKTADIYEALCSRHAQHRLKRLDFRLAIFDRILGKGTSTFSTLQEFYPLYLEGLVAKGATLPQIKDFLDDIDGRMDALGPFNMDDPLLADLIDDRISKVLDDMSKSPDSLTGEIVLRPGPGANNGNDDGSQSAGKDAYAWSCGNAYSGSSTSVIGHPRSTCNQCNTKGYIQFNVNDLPSAVQDVYLGVTHLPHDTSCITMCNANFYFYPVLEAWNEMTIGSGAMVGEGPAVSGPVNISYPNNFGVKEYKITDIYKNWKTGETPNNGLAIYSPDSGCVNCSVMFSFHSSDDPDPAKRPYLKVIYLKPAFLAFYTDTLYAYLYSNPVFQAVKDSYGAGDPIVYVSSDGIWGGKMPSYTTTQEAVDAAGEDYAVKVKEGDYSENIVMWESKKIELAGGYDDSFSSAALFSRIRALEIKKGTICCKGIVIGPK